MSISRFLLPESVSVAEADPCTADPASLPRAEAALVTRAVERRQREFAAGRALARGLLKSLGHDGPLGAMADGRPDWPAGIVGSIAHCRSLAAVAVARDSVWRGIGIDIEPDAPLSERIVRKIVVEEERPWVCNWEGGIGAAALRVFCAKEALYKAIYPTVLKVFDFDAVTVIPSTDGAGFAARLRIDLPPFSRGSEFSGRWQMRDGHFAAAVTIGAA
jgi:4'-phosphopantetheinyl transferase EntD